MTAGVPIDISSLPTSSHRYTLNGSVVDSVGGVDGSWQGTAAYRKGFQAKCGKILTSSDYIKLSAFNTNVNHTVSMIFKPENLDYSAIYSIGSSSNSNNYIALEKNVDGTIKLLNRSTSSTRIGSIPYKAGERMHLVVTYNSGTWGLYKNGEFQASGSKSGYTSNQFHLGRFANSGVGGTAIDAEYEDVIVWEGTVLSDAQIQTLFELYDDHLTLGCVYYGTLGDDAIDISGNGNHGTPVNVTSLDSTSDLTHYTLQQGKWSVYNGSNAYTTTKVTSIKNNMSFSAWVKTTTTSNGRIIGAYDGTNYLQVELRGSNNLLNLEMPNFAFTFDITGFNDGSAHHIEFDFDLSSNSANGYLDGVSKTINYTTQNNQTPFTLGRALWIGARNNQGSPDGYFTGNFKDFKIDDRQLSTNEISALYNSGAGYRPNHLRQGCVFATKFDGNSNDETENANDGTDTNITYTTGVIDQAAEFNGGSSSTAIPDLGQMNEFTVTTWANFDTVSVNQSIFHKSAEDSTGDSTGHDYRLLMLSTGNLQYGIGNGSSIVGGSVASGISINIWNRLSLKYDGSDINLVKNDSIIATTASTFTPKNTPTNTYIGKRVRNTTDLFLDGTEDEFMIFNIALSADLEAWLYNGGSPTTTQQYPFVEGVGLLAYNAMFSFGGL